MGYVYFLAYDDEEFRYHFPVIKIGSTYSLEKRIQTLSTASAVPLLLVGFINANQPANMEARLHMQFKFHRMNGEWFKATPGFVEELEKLDLKASKLDGLFKFDEHINELENLRYELHRYKEINKNKNAQIDALLDRLWKVDPEYDRTVKSIWCKELRY